MNIISLFSGAGGLDLGFEQEGFHPIVAYDMKSAAVRTYNYNRHREIARQADLSCVVADDLIHDIRQLELACSPRGVVGGPPCQYFSNGNREPRRQDDPRRTLPVTYANLLKRLNQVYELDFFILENVAGLAKPAHKEDFKHIVELFEGAGFRVFYKILDAYNFGVPQTRERLFLVGWNSSLYPEVEYIFPEGNPSGLTVKHAIAGLEEPLYYRENLVPEDFPEHPNHWTMQPVSAKFRNPPPPDLKKTTRSFRRLSWSRPSYTVAYGHNEVHLHPEGHRRLSIYEAMLLQGFPRERGQYRLLGTFTEQVTLISDAVPPPLAAVLARSFSKFIAQNRR